jgi:hypothetical protein
MSDEEMTSSRIELSNTNDSLVDASALEMEEMNLRA